MSSHLQNLKSEVLREADSERGRLLQRFFKTGKGEYGEGDVFAGLTVPQSRNIARKYKSLKLTEIEKLIRSKVHEERLIALLILVAQFDTGDETTKRDIYEFYLNNTKHINNWDLVDLSASKIVGEYLRGRQDRSILKKLAKSNNLWERRIAIISTFQFIYYGDEKDALEIAGILVNDKHDLIQKAVGWMLREIGKRISEKTEEDFLKMYYKTMPRTTLRYAIELFEEKKRKMYLNGSI